jgi:hypothetical protein
MESGWGTIAQWFGVLVAFLAINAATVRWLLDRSGASQMREANRVDAVAKELTELKINLPLEYVRRDDWIRFSSTIDGKIDRMRDEMREEIQKLRHKVV